MGNLLSNSSGWQTSTIPAPIAVGHNDPALQLSVSTTKPDHISEHLEVTRKMTRYFKKIYKNGKSYHITTDSSHSRKSQSNSHDPDKYSCRKSSNTDHVNEITYQMWSLKGTKLETKNKVDHHEWLSRTGEVIEVTISDIKYAANFPVTVTEEFLFTT